MDSRLPKLIFVLLLIYAAVYMASFYPKLPETVASHFNAQGRPNGWQSKQIFLEFFAGVTIITIVISFIAPLIIRTLPVQLINLPNKHYWLSSDRAAETYEFFGAAFAWLGCALYAMMLFVFNYAEQSNLHPASPPDPNTMWYAIFGFAAFALIWAIRFAVHFSRAPETGF